MNAAVINAPRSEAVPYNFNPFLVDPARPDGTPVVGPYARPGEMFRARAFIDVSDLVRQTGSQFGLSPGEVAALAPAASPCAVLTTPAHQFNLDGKIGNRIVFYGGQIGHAHIDQVVEELGKKHMRVLKVMTHFDSRAGGKGSQGGFAIEIAAEQVGGSTHVGGFSSGWLDGKPHTVKSDWPADYGHLGDGEGEHYNAHLIAIDYQGGVKKPIPEATLAAYKRNADMWDCAACLAVPFATSDPDPRFQDYKYNALEVYDKPSAVRLADSLAQINPDVFMTKHGAFYCAEGQYCIANLGPQEKTLLQRKRYGSDPFGKLIDNFAAAPGYAQMSGDERRKRPEIGWQHLLAKGLQLAATWRASHPDHQSDASIEAMNRSINEAGYITQAQYDDLVRTNRHCIHLDWIGDDIKGWQEYEVRQADGLIARPMSVAAMAWGLFRRYLPRAGIASIVAAELGRVYSVGSSDVKSAVTKLAGGADPTSSAGKSALAARSMSIATGLAYGIISNPALRYGLLKQGGYEEIPSDQDRAKVQQAYTNFLKALENADYTSQASMDDMLRAEDKKLGDVAVESVYVNLLTKTYQRRDQTPMMLYAAPACFVLWAQHPWYAETTCLRYVATAMHVHLRKA